jgi:hypothetical protein
MPARASRRRTVTCLVAPLLALAAAPPRTLGAQDSAYVVPRTLESLERDEFVRLRLRGANGRDTTIIARFRSLDGDTIRVVPEPRAKPLFHHGKPAAFVVPQLAALDVGRRGRGGRESVNRGARQGLVNGVVGFAIFGALVAVADHGCDQRPCLFGNGDPWDGAVGGAMVGLTIGPVIGAIAGGARTTWRWRPVIARR